MSLIQMLPKLQIRIFRRNLRLIRIILVKEFIKLRMKLKMSIFK